MFKLGNLFSNKEAKTQTMETQSHNNSPLMANNNKYYKYSIRIDFSALAGFVKKGSLHCVRGYGLQFVATYYLQYIIILLLKENETLHIMEGILI